MVNYPFEITLTLIRLFVFQNVVKMLSFIKMLRLLAKMISSD